jgi:putative Mn2+ efflux pump MntP
MKLGERIGILFSHRIEILGGLILIGIGLKIFLEHILAA